MFDLIDAKILDKNAEFFGYDMEYFMNNAGKAVADAVMKEKPNNVLVVCGSGNNGGDGYTTAIILKKNNFNVKILMVKEPETQLCKKKYDESLKEGMEILKDANFDDYDVIVDAMLGIGITGVPRSPYKEFIEKLNASKSKIISVDVPSGFPSPLQVRADITVTMQIPKKGMDEKNSGKIVVADVGFPKELIEKVGPGDMLSYKKNEKESHKGQNGVLVAIGGSINYYGAPLYMVKSSLRMGIDLVYLFAPESIHPYIASNTQDIILKRSGFNYIEFNEELKNYILEKADAVLLGPGVSKTREVLENSRKIIDFSLRNNKKIVVDGDALSVIPDFNDFKNLCVITPHRGEFKNIFNLDPNEENAMKMAKKYNLVILLKGPVDIITDGENVRKNVEFHHESMTRGGTGDVLSGSLAGLIAKGIDPFHAARLASFIVGYTGLLTFQEKSYSYYTSEIIDNIPAVFKKFL